MKQWNRKYKRCIKCHKTTIPHQAKGVCSTCYSRDRYANDPEYRRKHKEHVYNWMKRNPERTREIMDKASSKWQSKNRKRTKEAAKRQYLKIKADPKKYAALLKSARERQRKRRLLTK